MLESKNTKELVEEAFNLIVTGGETNMALAILLLKKAKETPGSSFDSNHIELYMKFVETMLGIKSSKEDILRIFLNGLNHTDNRNTYSINIEDLEMNGKRLYGVNFKYSYKDFLQGNLVDFWHKSLKYDAIKKVFDARESDGLTEKEMIKRVMDILGPPKVEDSQTN